MLPDQAITALVCWARKKLHFGTSSKTSERVALLSRHASLPNFVVKPVNVASVKHLSVFRYPGGKTWFVPWLKLWLRSLEEKPQVLIEPFGGGGISALTAVYENLVSSALIAEKDPSVSAVWKACLSDDAPRLAKKIRGFDFDPETVMDKIEKGLRKTDPVELAFAVILLNRIRRGGVMAPGAGVLKNGENGNGLVSRWYPETLAMRVETIFSLRERIKFIEGDGTALIAKYKGKKNAAMFADPPYTHAGKRLYLHWVLNHEKFLKKIRNFCGPFIATYDDTEEVRGWAQACKLEWAKVPMKSTGHQMKEELVIGRDLSWLKPRVNV